MPEDAKGFVYYSDEIDNFILTGIKQNTVRASLSLDRFKTFREIITSEDYPEHVIKFDYIGEF